MLEFIRFKADYRCFEKGYKLTFKPGLNLLVGDQGSGKSTVIQLIRDAAATKSTSFTRKDAEKVVKVLADGPTYVRCFDFEKDNPRTQSGFGDNIMFQVASIWKSHGEVARAILSTLTKMKDLDKSTFVLDEPDTALSPRSCYDLVKVFRKATKAGTQLLVAAHNPILIEGAPEVYSLEHREWMSGVEFLRRQREEKAPKPKEPDEKKGASRAKSRVDTGT
jgi:predicted ATPase